jgi:hypothetical protein
MNDYLGMACNEVIVTYFKVVSQYCGTEENHDTPSEDSRPLGRELNPGTPEPEVGVLTTQ